MTKPSRLIALSLLALSSLAFAGMAGFTIKRVPKADETATYKIKADLEFMGQPITFTARVESKVTKVYENGNYDVEEAQLDGKVNFNGNDMDMPTQGGPTTSTFVPGGLLQEIKGDMVSSSSYRMAILGMVVEPGKEVAVDEVWTKEIKADPKTGVVAAKAEFKVLGEEKVDAWDTLKVKYTIKETEGDLPASADGIVWLAKSDATVVKMETKWVNAPIAGAPEPVTAAVVMTREK